MVVRIPFSGNHLEGMAMKNMRISAKKNDGIDTPVRENTVQKLSNSPYFFTADLMPTGMAMRNAKIIATTLR